MATPFYQFSSVVSRVKSSGSARPDIQAALCCRCHPGQCPHLKYFAALLESGEDADVTFQVDKETLEAHSCILRACSPVFDANAQQQRVEERRGGGDSVGFQRTCLCCCAVLHSH